MTCWVVHHFLVFAITAVCCVTPTGDRPGTGVRVTGLAPVAKLALASRITALAEVKLR